MTTPVITSLPTPPNPSDRSTFNTRAYPWSLALGTFTTEVNSAVTWMNATSAATLSYSTAANGYYLQAAENALIAQQAAAAAMNGPTTYAETTENITFGTGPKTFYMPAGKTWSIGQFIIIANKADPSKYMSGQITNYNSLMQSIDVNVVLSTASGTANSWVFSLTANSNSSLIVNTPSGGISATNVQAAINELDSEKLAKSGGTMTGELVSSYGNAFRMTQGNYGVFWRNDGNNTYLMVTASGDPNGTFTAARPFTLVNATGVASINGNAATATKLATACTINGVSFDGTANITVADSTKLPTAGGTMTGDLTLTGNGRRIRGLFGAVPVANRALFQTTEVNGGTTLGVLPNGTGNSSYYSFSNSSDPDNAAYGYIGIDSNSLIITCTALGSGVKLPINIDGRLEITTGGNVLSRGGALGYGIGSGGMVTQTGSRTSGVVLNKPSGQITLVSAAGSPSWQSFTLTNSTISSTDSVLVTQKSGTDLYLISVTAVATGSCRITFATTEGTTTEQPVFNFQVIKGTTS